MKVSSIPQSNEEKQKIELINNFLDKIIKENDSWSFGDFKKLWNKHKYSRLATWVALSAWAIAATASWAFVVAWALLAWRAVISAVGWYMATDAVFDIVNSKLTKSSIDKLLIKVKESKDKSELEQELNAIYEEFKSLTTQEVENLIHDAQKKSVKKDNIKKYTSIWVWVTLWILGWSRALEAATSPWVKDAASLVKSKVSWILWNSNNSPSDSKWLIKSIFSDIKWDHPKQGYVTLEQSVRRIEWLKKWISLDESYKLKALNSSVAHEIRKPWSKLISAMKELWFMKHWQSFDSVAKRLSEADISKVLEKAYSTDLNSIIWQPSLKWFSPAASHIPFSSWIANKEVFYSSIKDWMSSTADLAHKTNHSFLDTIMSNKWKIGLWLGVPLWWYLAYRYLWDRYDRSNAFANLQSNINLWNINPIRTSDSDSADATTESPSVNTQTVSEQNNNWNNTINANSEWTEVNTQTNLNSGSLPVATSPIWSENTSEVNSTSWTHDNTTELWVWDANLQTSNTMDWNQGEQSNITNDNTEYYIDWLIPKIYWEQLERIIDPGSELQEQERRRFAWIAYLLDVRYWLLFNTLLAWDDFNSAIFSKDITNWKVICVYKDYWYKSSFSLLWIDNDEEKIHKDIDIELVQNYKEEELIISYKDRLDELMEEFFIERDNIKTDEFVNTIHTYIVSESDLSDIYTQLEHPETQRLHHETGWFWYHSIYWIKNWVLELWNLHNPTYDQINAAWWKFEIKQEVFNRFAATWERTWYAKYFDSYDENFIQRIHLKSTYIWLPNKLHWASTSSNWHRHLINWMTAPSGPDFTEIWWRLFWINPNMKFYSWCIAVSLPEWVNESNKHANTLILRGSKYGSRNDYLLNFWVLKRKIWNVSYNESDLTPINAIIRQ